MEFFISWNQKIFLIIQYKKNNFLISRIQLTVQCLPYSSRFKGTVVVNSTLYIHSCLSVLLNSVHFINSKIQTGYNNLYFVYHDPLSHSGWHDDRSRWRGTGHGNHETVTMEMIEAEGQPDSVSLDHGNLTISYNDPATIASGGEPMVVSYNDEALQGEQGIEGHVMGIQSFQRHWQVCTFCSW